MRFSSNSLVKTRSESDPISGISTFFCFYRVRPDFVTFLAESIPLRRHGDVNDSMRNRVSNKFHPFIAMKV